MGDGFEPDPPNDGEPSSSCLAILYLQGFLSGFAREFAVRRVRAACVSWRAGEWNYLFLVDFTASYRLLGVNLAG